MLYLFSSTSRPFYIIYIYIYIHFFFQSLFVKPYMVSEPMATNTTQPPVGVTKQPLVSNMSNMIMESQVKCVNLKLSLV